MKTNEKKKNEGKLNEEKQGKNMRKHRIHR